MPRRIPKLSVAKAVGELKLNISKERWLHIEKAYDCLLSNTARRQIVTSTIEFLESEKFERNAEPLSWTKKKIERIKEAVAKLTAEVQRAAEGDDTLLEARYRITEKFQHPRLTGRAALGEFEELSFQLSIACHRALKDIEETKDPGFRVGDSWDQWVRALTRIAAKFKLPIHASKGTDKNPDYKSPFLLLIDELQKCLPVECWRHTHSHVALAQAISRARAAGRERKSRSPI